MNKINCINNSIVSLVIACFLLYGNYSLAQAPTQPTHPIFYLHGFTNGASQLESLAVAMKSLQHFNWTVKGELPSYYSSMFNITNGIVAGAADVKGQLTHTADYIGVGYSAGGLVGRSVVHATAGTSFMSGLVTINTPHLGAYMADFWFRQNFAFKFTAAQGQINRADWSILSTIASTVIQALFWLPVSVANAVDQLGNGFLVDMKPGSSYLGGINNTSGSEQAAETNLPGGVASCWGNMGTPLSPAYNAPDNNLIGKQTEYFNKIRDARNKANEYQQTADRINSGRRWWQFWKWPSIWWNRLRASDWRASADGIIAANSAWEEAVGTFVGGDVRNPSDAFILGISQRGDPVVPVNRRFQLNADNNGNCTHGIAIINYGNNYNQIEAAMRAVGAQ